MAFEGNSSCTQHPCTVPSCMTPTAAQVCCAKATVTVAAGGASSAQAAGSAGPAAPAGWQQHHRVRLLTGNHTQVSKRYAHMSVACRATLHITEHAAVGLADAGSFRAMLQGRGG